MKHKELRCDCAREKHTYLSCGPNLPTEAERENDPRLNHGAALLMIANQNRRIAELEKALYGIPCHLNHAPEQIHLCAACKAKELLK